MRLGVGIRGRKKEDDVFHKKYSDDFWDFWAWNAINFKLFLQLNIRRKIYPFNEITITPEYVEL